MNKCGFKNVEFNHKGYPGSNEEAKDPIFDEFEFFRFEKVMTKASSDVKASEN